MKRELAVMCVMLFFAISIINMGCGERFSWDEEAQRCRDNTNGQWVSSEACGK